MKTKITKLVLASCLLVLSNVSKAQTYTVNTIAGSSVNCGYSGDGGPAAAATFSAPRGIASDSFGNLYIADTYGYRIRKVDGVTGIVTTICGNGTAGFSGDGGPAVSALVDLPMAIEVSPNGNSLVFEDHLNWRIRKIDLITGIITTIVGNGNTSTPVTTNVTATNTGIFGIGDIAFSPIGDLYFSTINTGDHGVYKVDKVTNIVTKYAGNGVQFTSSGDGGLATSAGLSQPTGITFDGAGNLYIADAGNCKIRKVDPTTNIITRIAGLATNSVSCGYSGNGGPATSAKLYNPFGVALDNNGNLIINDGSNYRLRIVNLNTGIINAFMGTGGNGQAGDGGPAIFGEVNTSMLESNYYGHKIYINGSCNVREIGLNGNSNMICGNVFVDCNNNCTKQPNETYAYSACKVVIFDGTNSYTVFPNAYGNYSFNSIAAGMYTITPIALTNYSLCSSASFTANITSTTTIGFNFGVKEITAPLSDYSSFLTSSNANPGPGAVPGGTITINVYNTKANTSACTNVLPTKLKVVLPPLMTFGMAVGTTTAPNAIIPTATGDTLVWNNPMVNDLHQFTAITATSAVIGSGYCIKSIIYPLADVVPSNNLYSFCRNYGGPYDPNEKSSDALGMAANGDIFQSTNDITYTILFQNLGNGPAVNVLIKDTIDANLDLNSMQILQSSFPVQTQINTTTREVNFRFNTIYLQPAITNEPASHGFVRYKVNLTPSLPAGTTIKNRGHIYFDYNSAISTNQTINTIIVPTNIKETELSRSIMLYPNPTNGNLHINAASPILKIEIVNCIGQVVITKDDVKAETITLDLGELTQGIYFVQLSTEKGIVTKKLIKK